MVVILGMLEKRESGCRLPGDGFSAVQAQPASGESGQAATGKGGGMYPKSCRPVNGFSGPDGSLTHRESNRWILIDTLL